MEAKNAGQQLEKQLVHQGKSLIDKDNLRDEDFDKLVIDISNIVSSNRIHGHKCKNQHSEEAITPNSTGGGQECCCYNNLCAANDDVAEDEHQHQELASSSTDPTSQTDVNYRLKQPKRPMNAFMVWGRAIRRGIHLRFSNVQNALLSKALGRVWRSLDSAAKEPYIRRANLIKANHRRNYPDYRYQPRRLQEKEKIIIKVSEPTSKTSDIIATQPNSQYYNLSDDQIDSVSALGAIHPIISGGYAAHRGSVGMEPSGSGRLQDEYEAHMMPTPNQCYVSTNFTCQDNNHIDNTIRNGISYCASCGTSDDVQHLKAQYYDGYHASQQNRTLPNKQHYSYHPGPYQHQHQFVYSMQLQPHQHQQTYQQSHLIMQQQQQQPSMSEAAPRITYVENCSLSATNPGLDGGSRFLTIAETNTGLAKAAYESRN